MIGNVCPLLVKHGRLGMPVYLYLLLMPTKVRAKGYKVQTHKDEENGRRDRNGHAMSTES